MSARGCAAGVCVRACGRPVTAELENRGGCDSSLVIALHFPSHSSCFVQTAGPAGPQALEDRRNQESMFLAGVALAHGHHGPTQAESAEDVRLELMEGRGGGGGALKGD